MWSASSQGDKGLLLTGGPHNDPGLADGVVVEGVERLAVLQHNVVGHVHHVVDGALARLGEPVLHPLGRRADPDSLHNAGGVPGAQRRIDYIHVNKALHGFTLLCIGEVRLLDDRSCEGRHLSGDAQHREAVRPVGGDIQVKDHVAHVLLERRANGRVLRQHHNAVVVVAKGKLPLGADHARGLHAANFRRLQRLRLTRPGVDQPRAHLGKGHLLPCRDVGRAADNGHLLVPQADGGQPQAVRVGMGVNAGHIAHKDVLP